MITCSYTEDGIIRLEKDGEIVFVPDDMTNASRQEIAAWEADGNNIAPWSPLPATEVDVRAEGARRLALIGSPYSSEERETWSQQVAEAKSVLADPNAAAPLLSVIAAGDNVSVSAMATIVVQKADAFALAAGAVLAAQRALIASNPIPADYADDTYWP